MSAVNANWQKWVVASFYKVIKTAADSISLPFFVDGLDVKSDAFKEADHKFEIVISGPSTSRINTYQHNVDVTLFCTFSSFKQHKNRYTHLNNIGTIENALDKCILIETHGTLPLTEVGQLDPIIVAGNKVRVTHIRGAEGDNQVHSVLEIAYNGTFSEA